MPPVTSLHVVAVDTEQNRGDDQRSATVICIVQDQTPTEWRNSKFHVNMQRSATVQELYERTAKELSYEADSFLLVWKGTTEPEHELELLQCHLTLDQICLPPGKGKHWFFVRARNGANPVSTKEQTTSRVATENIDHSLGDGSLTSLFDDSTNKTTSLPSYGPYTSASYTSTTSGYTNMISKSETGFVGLVNQAMTCYLNSFLQTLFMTPEFRNAIYNWKFEGGLKEAEKSIPYQLQRLFVRLQFSKKRAVETTDVTKSFGWDSSDAWHQHDVQELCRVMFDALETVFKDTDQADLINKLYQGKLKDYVKCLECGSESARLDLFLDIPLVIRPFGVDKKPHRTVEEALHAFVHPERLDGNNQYKCEKCAKLCDADKGLKFCSFPYLLALQLKRFAFDFNLLHRVKLNDRLTFPEILNLNKYAMFDDDDCLSQKSDSPSSVGTDSGVSVEGGSDNGVSIDDDISDVTPEGACCMDEDVDMMSEGPYIYELYSIMIHSGSAIGGHYYAYIKSFEDNRWYSFNDQNVTKITEQDIERTYGGFDSSKSYYSSHYSSSANAYMLMYRQKCPERNVVVNHQLPKHVEELLEELYEQERREEEAKDFERNVCRIKMFCREPISGEMLEHKFEVHKDKTLGEATKHAWKLFKLENAVSLENCRIVRYDEYNDIVEVSFEGKEEERMETLLCGVQQTYFFDLMLETKRDGEKFPVYLPGGIAINVFKVDMSQEYVSDPVSIRVLWSDAVSTLYDVIRMKLGESAGDHMRLIWERNSADFYEIKNDETRTLKDENFFKQNKVYVVSSDVEPELLISDQFKKVVDDYCESIRLNITLPREVPLTAAANRLRMRVNKNITLEEFKRKLEEPMGCSSELFKIFRMGNSNNQEMEMDRLKDTFSTISDETKIIVKYGRALKIDEFRCKIFLFDKDKSEHSQLTETIFSKCVTVLESKNILHQQLVKEGKQNIPVERMRFRNKSWKSPGKIFLNEEKCDVITAGQSVEMFVEELPGAEPLQTCGQLSLYMRRWHRSTFKIDPVQEIIVHKQTSMDNLMIEISKHSEIEPENIEIAKGRGSFPCDISMLDIEDDLQWNPDAEHLNSVHLLIHNDGALLYYRDKTETLLKLTDDEKNKIKKADLARTSSSATKSRYKPKEKALKIYTDR